MNNSKIFACLFLSLSTLGGLNHAYASVTNTSLSGVQETTYTNTLFSHLAPSYQLSNSKPSKRKKFLRSKKKNQGCYFNSKKNRFNKKVAKRLRNNVSNCYSHRKIWKKIF